MPRINPCYFTAADRTLMAQLNESLTLGLRTSTFRANEDGRRFDVGNFLDRNGNGIYTCSKVDGAYEVENVAMPSMEEVISTVLSWEKARLV